MDTPAFLVWSLEYTCAVRGGESGRDPDRIERLLRAARAASQAVCEGRVLDDIGVDPPFGFRLTEALTLYGGQAAVEAACRGCPANALSRQMATIWAGCFGIVPFPPIAREWTSDWYKLWLHSPLTSEQAADAAATVVRTGRARASAAFAELVVGLQTAAASSLAFHFQHYPPGRVEQGWWRLVPHCPRCKAPWGEPTERHCLVCDYRGVRAPDQKRRARGRRPYLALGRLLGEAGAEEFLKKYELFRAQPGPRDQAPAQQQPGPPDNHLDD